jgi:hypothetical protein
MVQIPTERITIGDHTTMIRCRRDNSCSSCSSCSNDRGRLATSKSSSSTTTTTRIFRRRRRLHGSSNTTAKIRILLNLLVVVLVIMSCFYLKMIKAFHYHHHLSFPRDLKTKQQQLTSLNLFRPDWMRRAGRIEEKRKERKQIYNSLHKRQNELGIMRPLPITSIISYNNTNNFTNTNTTTTNNTTAIKRAE